MWELDYKESWELKNWCFWTVVLEKTLEGPLDYKQTQPVHLKGDQPWVFIGRTDVEAETPVLWAPPAKSWLIGKDPDAGKDWGQEEKGRTEDEMVGWHHRLNGCGFGWTEGVGDGQGGLACCGSWDHKELDMTERLNWNWVGFLVTQLVKNLPAVQEIWVWFMGQEDPLVKGMATHSNIVAWRIPWTEEPGGLQSMGIDKCVNSIQVKISGLCHLTWLDPVFLIMPSWFILSFCIFYVLASYLGRYQLLVQNWLPVRFDQFSKPRINKALVFTKITE